MKLAKSVRTSSTGLRNLPVFGSGLILLFCSGSQQFFASVLASLSSLNLFSEETSG